MCQHGGAWYFTGIFSLEWGLYGYWGHVLLCPSAMSQTSVNHLNTGMFYNLSRPQDCTSTNLIKSAKCIHSPVPDTQ